MVKCPNCGEENRDGLKVCLHCGSDLVKPEPEPSRPGKGGLPPEPKKSGHKLRNGVIILVILLILFFIASAIAPNFLATDSSTVNSIQSSDSLMSIGDDSSSQSSDNSQLFSKDNDDSSSNSGNSFLSTKTENFDGFFTMDVDEDMEFEGFDDSANCERYWTYLGDTYTNKSGVTVYFWLMDKNYTFENLDHFNVPEKDGNMLIYTNKAKEEGFPQAYDYLVMVGNDEEVVGIEGADLGTLKKYANSVKF